MFVLISNIFAGKLKEGDKKYKGKFEIPNLSEENEPDEVDVSGYTHCNHLNILLTP